MPVWGWILVAFAVAIFAVAIVIAAKKTSRRNTERLKSRFGPEYQRTVLEAGDEKAAEKELAERERKRDKLDIRPLTPAALDGYVKRWRVVQTAFVDHPSSAVGEADILVTEVMRERGYPVDDFDQRAADISVDHPDLVERYRTADGIARANERGEASTEDLRHSVRHYRALFQELLVTEREPAEAQR
jgi:hypothetical protein